MFSLIENAELKIYGLFIPRGVSSIIGNKYKKKNIKILGMQTPEDIYLNIDVMILPSFFEGSAKSIYEAMSYAIPVITTYNAGSIIDHNKNGLIIKPGNVDHLYKACKYFILNKQKIKIMGDHARNKVKKYTWKNYQRKICKEILNLK